MNVTEKHIFTYRKSELPIFTIHIFNKTKTINSALHLANERDFMFNKLEQNFFRSIDLNLYFFGNHPRERAGIREFEKYTFLFLPFFFLGLYRLVTSNIKYPLVSLIIPLILLSFIGQDNPIGPFGLFPFYTATISVGILLTHNKLFSLLQKYK